MSTKPYKPFLLNELKNLTVAVEFLSSSLSSLNLDECEMFLDAIRNVEQARPDCQISFEKITEKRRVSF